MRQGIGITRQPLAIIAVSLFCLALVALLCRLADTQRLPVFPLISPILLALVAGGMLLEAWSRASMPVINCPRCEYPFVGLTSFRCPECGLDLSGLKPPIGVDRPETPTDKRIFSDTEGRGVDQDDGTRHRGST